MTTLNSSVAAWLLIGMSVIPTVLIPQAVVAAQPSATQSQAQTNLNSIDAASHYQQGLKSASVGEMQDAIGRFDRAIAIDPRYFQAYIERGNVKDAIGDYPGAIADYTIAISIDTKAAPAYYNRGTVLSQSGKHTEAIVDYRKAIAINPQYAQAHLNLANELDDLGDIEGALTGYNQAIALKPNYALAYLNRGIMYGRAGKRAQAIADLTTAARLFQLIGQIDRYNRAIQMIKDIQSEV